MGNTPVKVDIRKLAKQAQYNIAVGKCSRHKTDGHARTRRQLTGA